MTLLQKGTQCRECIVKTTGITTDEVHTLVERIGRVLTVTHQTARCETCQQTTLVYHLGRPANTT
jgi:hypothetical protein